MFVENVAGHKKLFVSWRYDGRSTLCEIRDDSKTAIQTGSAVCSRKDRLVRNKGRKESLAKALKIFEREARVKFWEAYNAMRNGAW